MPLSLSEHPSKWAKADDEDWLAHRGEVPGFYPIDKPKGLNSRPAAETVRKALGAAKAGHTGTLDPFATGVLVVALDEALRVVKYVEEWTKTYRGTVLLGTETDSWDITGAVLRKEEVSGVRREDVEEILGRMRGFVRQPTPPVSAARLGGKRLYELARRGRQESPERIVRIDSLQVLSFRPPRVEVEVVCGRGTYIRSIAQVLGTELGTGAVLEELVRLREGPFRLRDCLPFPPPAPGACTRSPTLP